VKERAKREGFMKRSQIVGVAVLVALSVASATSAETAITSAQSVDEASLDDLRRLQDNLANLDGEIAALEPGDAKADAFRSRAEAIREETVYLKVKMEHHQRDGGSGTGLSREEVARVRRLVDELRDDIAAAFGREERELRLPEGTSIQVRLEHALSSKTARRKDRVDASVAEPVRAAGVIALPAGTVLTVRLERSLVIEP
jgi:hypothetical protein